MNTKSFLSGFLLLAAITAIQNAVAQTDSCNSYLKTAAANYEQRDFDGAIKLLQTAVSTCDLDNDDELQAHKLLALSYLAIDNLEAADKEAETIIQKNPNYAPDRFKDDPKYSALFEKFESVPVLSIGITAGLNRSFIHIANMYSIVHDDHAENLGEYNSKTGFQLGATVKYNVYKDFGLELGGVFRQSEYEHVLFNVENTNVNFSEVLNYIDVPVSVNYSLMNGQVSPYVEAGAAFSFLTNALSTSTRDNNKDLVSRTDYRNKFAVGYFGGAGVEYKIKSFHVFANVRYTFVDKYINKAGTRYSDEVNVFKYYYIDDDFSMNGLQIRLGVSYNVTYKSQK